MTAWPVVKRLSSDSRHLVKTEKAMSCKKIQSIAFIFVFAEMHYSMVRHGMCYNYIEDIYWKYKQKMYKYTN